MNTNKHNPGGHERKIVTKLQNMEKNNRVVAPVGGKGATHWTSCYTSLHQEHLSRPEAQQVFQNIV